MPSGAPSLPDPAETVQALRARSARASQKVAKNQNMKLLPRCRKTPENGKQPQASMGGRVGRLEQSRKPFNKQHAAKLVKVRGRTLAEKIISSTFSLRAH